MPKEEVAKTPAEFVAHLREKKVEGMWGLIHDFNFFKKVVADLESEMKLDEIENWLEEEKKKLSLDNKGKVIADNRDHKKVSELTVKRDKIRAFMGQMEKTENMIGDMEIYLDYIDNLPEEVKKQMEEAK